MQIKIENRKEPKEALEIIDKNINNLKEKVECLQLYAPKLFKAIQQAKTTGMGIATSMFEINKSTLVEQLQSLVRTIVGAMVEYKKLKQFKSDGIRHY